MKRCTRALTGAMVATVTLGAQSAANPLPPTGPADSVEAERVDGIDAVRLWRDFVAPRQAPDHPPIDKIPPMPMGDCTDCPEGMFLPDEGVMVHNAMTGETFELHGELFRDAGADGGSIPGYVGADGEDLMPESFRGFGSMSAINNTTSFPWRANTKMVMRFEDEDGINRWFVCSATMIDAAVALTAAHCVYSRSPTIGGQTVNIFDWAKEVWIYPGWDGEGSTFAGFQNGIVEPFGFARGTSYSAGSAYINDGDFNRDVGVVRLRRPVGMVTGWFGRAWGFGCSTIQDRTYHNASYPSEDCNDDLHTGRQMYYWFGGIDSCPGNQLQIDTSPGCLTAMWGGMSGSSAYYISDGNRFAHAVASNSNRSTRGRFAKVWESAHNAWTDFIADTRGDTFDLAPLRMELEQTTIQAGESFSGTRRHLATNATNASRDDSFLFRVYLSDSPDISTSDTLLSTQSYSWDFGSMSSVNINMASFSIPIDTPPGTYYVGVIYDSATDSNPANNATTLWDAQEIEVTIAPPAQVTGPSPDDGAFAQPINQTLTWDDADRASFYRVYFGTSPNLTSSDMLGPTSSTSWLLPLLFYRTEYYWRIDSVNSAGTTTGETWSFRTVALNDDCSGAIEILPGTHQGDSSFHTASDADGCTRSDIIDAWYSFTPERAGTVTVELCDSNFNTTLAVFESCSEGPVACNDSGDECPGSQSSLTFQAEPGQTYYIRIAGRFVATGDYALELNFDPCIPDFAPPFGVLDIFDVLEFLTLFENEDPAADLSRPFGVWDIFDVLEFLDLFEQGCP